MKWIAIWILGGAASIYSLTSLASGAEITLSATITGTYSPDGSTVISNTGVVFDWQTPYAYRVDIFAQLTGTIGPTETFGATSFDIILGHGVSRVTTNNINIRSNWVPNDPLFSRPLIAESGGTLSSYWSGGDNADLGVSNTDLIGIVQDIDASTLGKLLDPDTFLPVPDPRVSIGRGGRFKLGSFFFVYDGGIADGIRFANVQYALADSASHLYQPSVSTIIPSIAFPVREAAGIDLAIFGGLLLIGMFTALRVSADAQKMIGTAQPQEAIS